MAGSIVVVLAVLLAAGGSKLAPRVTPPPATPTPEPVAMIQAEASPTPIQPQGAPADAAAAVPAPPTPAMPPPSEPCETECLVRLPATEAVAAVLDEFGVRPANPGGDVVWATVPAEVMTALAGRDVPVVVVEQAADTLPLYLVRLPKGAEQEKPLARELGTVIDEHGDQLIVSVPGPAPNIRDLADRGIAVEKFPPGRDAPETRAYRQLSAPWAPAEMVSAAEIERTVGDLQSMGAVDGLGTRHYQTAGNVAAAEYLFRRLAAYGLDVWYEDFIADTGALALNVVGEIPGRDPSKIFLLTAHFDSIASDTNDPSLAPGALDNGTGVATLLEVARVLSGYQLPHPVHIVFLNAEEAAMQGAAAFAAQAAREGRPYVAAMNIDSVGSMAPTNRLIVNADGASAWIQDVIVQINSDNPGLGIELLPRQNPAIVADDTELSKAGIPSVLLASVMYGDPSINQSQDTIAQVDAFRVLRITQLVVLALSEMLIDGA